MNKLIKTVAKKFAPALYGTLSERGREIPDPTPVSPPIGYKKHVSQADRLREMIRSAKLAQAAEEQGFETFEEAEDFNIPDDPIDPNTPYEELFDGGSRTAQEVLDTKRIEQRVAADRKSKSTPMVDTGRAFFSGAGFKQFVDYVRGASPEDVDKLVAEAEKEEPKP